MGTNGGDDMITSFSRSNAYDAIVKSQTPLLIVPSNYTFKTIKNSVYAFDYAEKKKLPLKQVKKFTSGLMPTITVLQILKDAYEGEEENRVKNLERILQQAHADAIKKFETIWSPDVAGTINAYVIENECDALLLCTVERNFLEGLFHKSVIKELCSDAVYPVFIFHE
jgi:hypothetical protein